MNFPNFGPDRAFGSDLGRSDTQTALRTSRGLIIERCTMFISSGNSESPVTASEVDHDAETFDNYHSTNPDHGQGVFASSRRAGSGQDYMGFFPLGFVLIFPSGE